MTTVLTHDGLRLHATAYGPADADVTVLLAHCWTADEQLWHYQVASLLSREVPGHPGARVRVVTWDARAHGRSEVPDEAACTITDLARDLGAVADALAPAGPLVLAGHSIGGMTLMALPDVRPDLVDRAAGLLLVATSAGHLGAGIDRLAARLPGGEHLVDRLPAVLGHRARRLSARAGVRRRSPRVEQAVVDRMLVGSPVRPRDAGLIADQLAAASPATMAGFVRDLRLHDREHLLRAWDAVPTVVLVGTADRLTPLSHGRRLASGIRGARLLVLPGAGHYLPLERDAVVSEQLAALVDAAVRSAVTEPAPA
ncbi:alpha/beta fold hydrolase [Nocardioides bruguierae]|uniref:alpha/beta fold hydrolase n=1 Tax=Nocardioides bruguierae TaxID=2945102 RepID=UPI002021BAA3|nr:alpha/beta fold hydrolase [Nocardioides bruguierae]MCL8024116.1 alpha/beta hydrolase [Nocardioides bruguierae]